MSRPNRKYDSEYNGILDRDLADLNLEFENEKLMVVLSDKRCVPMDAFDFKRYFNEEIIIKKIEEKFIPKFGEYYYWIDGSMQMQFDRNVAFSCDNSRIKVGNCFKGTREALQMRNKMLILLKEGV